MFTALKKTFGGTLQFTIESYGKLPFYKDYIAIVTSKPAIQWKAFLLDNFGQEGMVIPDGCWPFIYQGGPKTELIVGLIEESSDGIREFPFSIFTVCNTVRGDMPYCFETINGIWHKLFQIRDELDKVDNIDLCYRIIRGKMVQVKVGKKKPGEFTMTQDGEWPRLIVARSENHGELFMIMDGQTSSHGFIANWQKLGDESKEIDGEFDGETTQEFHIS